MPDLPHCLPTRTPHASFWRTNPSGESGATINYNIQTVVDSLKIQSRPVWERSPHFCATREVSAGMDRLDRVSDSMACLLSLCDGRHRIAEIVPRLSATLHDVKAPLGEYVCLRLLSGAQAEQFIDIYRTASSTKKETRSHGTAPRLFHRAHTIIGTLAFLMSHSPVLTSCPDSQL
jgi:hypothetical protein